MKVFMCQRRGGYSGGLAVVAANSKDLLKAFNNVINEIETTDGRVLSMYDVKKLTNIPKII